MPDPVRPTRCAVLLVAAIVLTVPAGAPAAAVDPAPSDPAPEPVRLLVGLPGDAAGIAPGDTVHGATVVDVVEAIDLVVVRTTRPAAVRSAALADGARYVEADRRIPVAATPDDPRFGDQYAPQQVDAPAAWDRTFGLRDATVAVIDTGVLDDHEDLVDAVGPDRDFVEDDPDADDECGHGTHVAGIAAAGTDNGVGVAGTAQASVVDAKAFSGGAFGCFGSISDIVEALTYVGDQDAEVVSMSFGGSSPSSAMRDAINYTIDAGALPVAAAGNSGPCEDCVIYPAAFPEVVAVTCTNATERQCGFSSQGPEAELAAPGDEVLSTWTANRSAYIRLSGTSMSTPRVSGVAALMKSANMSLDACRLRWILRDTARDLGDPGRDPVYGHGLVDADAAVQAAVDGVPADVCPDTPPVVDVLGPADGATLRANTTFTVRATSPSSTVERVELTVANETFELADPDGDDRWTTAFDTQVLTEERDRFTFSLRAVDADGRNRTTRRIHVVDNRFLVRVEAPDPGVRVAGDVGLEAFVDSLRSPVERVTLVADDAPIDITSNRSGSIYSGIWDSTAHVHEDDPATLTVRAELANGREKSDTVEVVVDNRPEPEAEVLEPEPGDLVVGAWNVVVRAETRTGADDLRVFVQVNDGAWRRAVQDPTNASRFRYAKAVLREPVDRNSTVRARAIDDGGVTVTDRVPVRVRGTNDAYHEAKPLVDCVQQMIEDIGDGEIEDCIRR